ncbi:MAG: DUF4179 domain-containing protein [Aurantibacter sp.]
MKDENLENIFKKLEGNFDTEEPRQGHELRFMEKLNRESKVVDLHRKKTSWWKPLSIAASVVVLIAAGIGLFNNTLTTEEQVAEISPEVANTQFYFASLIEEQVKQMENESTPETQKIISDTMEQLKRLETNYKSMENDLLNGGNSKLILSAMITNFQTRIGLLEEVMNKIESIKTLNDYDDENYTI